VGRKHSLEICERQASIENVFHQNYVAIADGFIEVFREPHFATGASAVAIAPHSNEVEGGIELHGTRQVTQENRCSLQHSNKDDRLAREVARDLSPKLADTAGDLLASKEHRKLGHGNA